MKSTNQKVQEERTDSMTSGNHRKQIKGHKMKRYTEGQEKHISNDGEYENVLLELDEGIFSPSRLYLKTEGTVDTYRVGNAKAGFYTLKIPEFITYEEAYHMLDKICGYKGISKTDLAELRDYIWMSISDVKATGSLV